MEALTRNQLDSILNKNVVMLFLNDRNVLDKEIDELFSFVSEKGFLPLYVTSSVPAVSVNAMLRSAKINDYKIIDTITNSLYNGNKMAVDKAIFIDSPADLTRLSMNIDQELRSNKDVFVFIDSITSFLIYNSEDEILRFIHYVSSVVRENDHRAFFVVLSNAGMSTLFIDKIRSFIDYEIKV